MLMSISAHRVHWFRASAVYKRWHEEMFLLEEEMSRCMRFFVHYRDKWEAEGTTREAKGELGGAAYARK